MSRQFPGTDSVYFIVRNTQQRILISRAKVGAAGRVQEVAAREAGSLVAQRCMQIPETEVAAAALCRPTEKLFTLSSDYLQNVKLRGACGPDQSNESLA